MDRRHFFIVAAGAVLTAQVAFAASFEDAVVAQLRAQGYRNVTTERTLLGRIRIVALTDKSKREIILNPRTGEILRDVVTDATDKVAPKIAEKSDSSGTQNGSSGSGNGGDDNGTDDNGTDDNGGSDDGGSDDNGGNTDNSGSGHDDNKDDSGSEDSGSDDSDSEDSGSDDDE